MAILESTGEVGNWRGGRGRERYKKEEQKILELEREGGSCERRISMGERNEGGRVCGIV